MADAFLKPVKPHVIRKTEYRDNEMKTITESCQQIVCLEKCGDDKKHATSQISQELSFLCCMFLKNRIS